jgi:hypothetical protein
MDTLNKFIGWENRSRTHTNRHIIVLQKQIDNMRSYVELFGKYPANSIEFKVEVERLYLEIKDICDEMGEVAQGFSDDSGSFIEILDSLKEDLKRKVKRERSKSG